MEELSGAQKDFLTGFYTRDHLISSLLKRIIEANLRKEQFSILLVDIDHFKKINDKYGHLWGDEFLKYVSSTLRLTLQDKGFIFRYGGDEFVVLFSSPDPKEAFLLAKQFNLVMRSRPFLFNGRLFRITLSCGLATYPDDAKGADDLLKLADKALYFSKRFGRNTTTRVGKIGWRRFKIILVVVLEAFFIMAAVSLLNTYFFKGSPIMAIKRLCFRGILPVGLGADTTIVLKSGEVILGSIISEDQDKLVVEVVLGQGSCTMNIEKSLIQDIIRSENKKKKGEK
jgi:diguanylate cyclase (GGDEF)-like protein